MENKPWYTSKTLWANILAGIATLSVAFGFDLGLTPETQVTIIGGFMAVLNIVLRLVTNQPIGTPSA